MTFKMICNNNNMLDVYVRLLVSGGFSLVKKMWKNNVVFLGDYSWIGEILHWPLQPD